MTNNQKGFSVVEALLVAIVLAMLGFGGWYVWQVNHGGQMTQKLHDESSTCAGALAQAFIKKDSLQSVQNCSIDEFLANGSEKFSLVEISYGEGQDCPAGCFYKHKTYLAKDVDHVAKAFDGFYQTPDLSLGSSIQACKYIYSSHLGAMLQTEHDHIKRSLITENGEYRWKLELNNFSGHAPGDPDRPKCLRTGVVTTNLEGNDLILMGSPQFQMEE